ncbi:MAG TPA: hypothetical protein VL914_09050 [Vicinamibacterales bacterium]|nr:hypothetical protein [Vicinamibacterales bacterium]
MKAEHYTERRDTIDGWPINIVTYRIGGKYYCTIDNVDPGARFARAEGPARDEVERKALEKAKKYLGQTRRFPTTTMKLESGN